MGKSKSAYSGWDAVAWFRLTHGTATLLFQLRWGDCGNYAGLELREAKGDLTAPESCAGLLSVVI